MAQTGQTPEPAGKRGGWLPLVIGVILGGAAVLFGVVFIGMPLALGHRNDLPLEKLYADLAVGLAVKTQAGIAQNPVGQNPRSIETGSIAYVGSCAVCHGATGDGKGMFGEAIYPPASDLRAHDTQEKSDAELFWIIKNGLSFAGMPGFAQQYSDQDIWNLVSYTRSLAGTGQAPLVQVPTATTAQLAVANPQGDAIGRGAAVYFAQGCQGCHGAVGDAPGELNLSRRGGRELEEAVREGRRGMPAYSADKVTDAQLNDLAAYVNSFRTR